MQRATTTFHISTKNGTRTVENGAVLEDDDPAVKGCPMFFTPADDEPKPAKKAPARRAPAKSTAKKDD